jgi:hypothetical protein
LRTDLWWNADGIAGNGGPPHHQVGEGGNPQDAPDKCNGEKFPSYGEEKKSIFDSVTLHCKENPIHVFLFWELRGLSPNFHIHVSLNDLQYIFPGLVYIFGCSKIDRPILEIYKSPPDILM